MTVKSNIYFAPLQGYTTLPYYEAFEQVTGGVRKYFSSFYRANALGEFLLEPFLFFRDQLDLVPQILTNKGCELVSFARVMAERGFSEINLNIGCPFPLVAHRHLGSGLLPFGMEIKEMLDVFFNSDTKIKLSVKTRLGWEDKCDFLTLMQIMCQYPVSELILHPRLGIQGYKGTPDWDNFSEIEGVCPIPLVGNGDICSMDDLREKQVKFANIKSWMIGRGLLMNPALLLGDKGEKERKDVVIRIHNVFYDRLKHYQYTDEQILNQLKNYWYYPGNLYPEDKKFMKKLKKVGKLNEYWDIVKDWK